LIFAFVIVTTLPSLYIAFNLVKETVFEREAGVFVKENFIFENAQVISKSIQASGDDKRIEVALIGEPISQEVIANIEAKMQLDDRLKDAKLIIRQGANRGNDLDRATVELMNQSMRSGIIEDLYKRNEEVIQSKDEKIKTLENEVVKLRSRDLPVADISRELKAQHENVEEFTLMLNPIFSMDKQSVDTVTFAYVEFKKRPGKEEQLRLESWLKTRTHADSLKLVIQTK